MPSLNDEERRGIVETVHALHPEMTCVDLGYDGRQFATNGGEVLECLDGPALLRAIGKLLTSKVLPQTPVPGLSRMLNFLIKILLCGFCKPTVAQKARAFAEGRQFAPLRVRRYFSAGMTATGLPARSVISILGIADCFPGGIKSDMFSFSLSPWSSMPVPLF
jgi:hypothetical protein